MASLMCEEMVSRRDLLPVCKRVCRSIFQSDAFVLRKRVYLQKFFEVLDMWKNALSNSDKLRCPPLLGPLHVLQGRCEGGVDKPDTAKV